MRLLRQTAIPFLLLSLAGLLPGGSRHADAGPFLDWLFGRDRNTAYSIPVTSACGTCNLPATTAYNLPVGYAAPATSGCGLFGDGGYAYNVSRIPTVSLPCTQYQTVAQRVPVSTYRPILGQMVGCQTSELQTARVPAGIIPVGYQPPGGAGGLQQVGTVYLPANQAAQYPNGIVSNQRPNVGFQSLGMPAVGGCATCAGGANLAARMSVPPQSFAGQAVNPYGMAGPIAPGFGGMTTTARPALPGGWAPSGPSSLSAAAPAAGGQAGGSDTIVSSRIIPADSADAMSDRGDDRWGDSARSSDGSRLIDSRIIDPAERQPTLFSGRDDARDEVVERPTTGDYIDRGDSYGQADDARTLSRPALRMSPSDSRPSQTVYRDGTGNQAPPGPGYSAGPSYYGGSAAGSRTDDGYATYGDASPANQTTNREPVGSYSTDSYGSGGYSVDSYAPNSSLAPAGGEPGCATCGKTNTGSRMNRDLPTESRLVDRRDRFRAATRDDQTDPQTSRMSLSSAARPVDRDENRQSDRMTAADPYAADRTADQRRADPWLSTIESRANVGQRDADRDIASRFERGETVTTRRPSASLPGLAPLPSFSEPESDDRMAGLPSLFESHQTERDRFPASSTSTRSRTGLFEEVNSTRSTDALPIDQLPPLNGFRQEPPRRREPVRRDSPRAESDFERPDRLDRRADVGSSVRPVSSTKSVETQRSRYDDSGWSSGS